MLLYTVKCFTVLKPVREDKKIMHLMYRFSMYLSYIFCVI